MALAKEMKLAGGNELAGALSYQLLIEQARDNLTLGLSVVLDSPAGYQRFRERVRELARAVKADLRVIEGVVSDDALWRERLERRGEELPDYRTRDWGALQSDQVRFERLTERRLVVDTKEPLTLNLSKVLAYIEQPAQSPGPES